MVCTSFFVSQTDDDKAQSFILEKRQTQAVAAEKAGSSSYSDQKESACGVWTRVQHEQCLLKEAGITAGSNGYKAHDADSLLIKLQAGK